MELAKIEDRIDRTEATKIAVSEQLGGMQLTNMVQIMEIAKMMAISKEAVPPHLRGEPGICLAVCIQAMEWRFSPFAVANQSYVVNGRLAYQSQLVHAVIEQRAPIQGRLRHRFTGEGDERQCVVWATPKGEREPLEYTSAPFAKITPKNSPLWKTKPDYQLYLNASRDWCRVYFPDTLLGIFSEDDLTDSEIGPDRARDVTPKLSERLRAKKGARGFSPDNVAALEHKPGETLPEAATASREPEPVTVAATTGAPATAQSALTSEPEMTLGAEIDNEVAEKKRALLNCKSEDDVKAISEAITALIRQHKRQDLLADFLSAVRDAEKRVTPK